VCAGAETGKQGLIFPQNYGFHPFSQKWMTEHSTGIFKREEIGSVVNKYYYLGQKLKNSKHRNEKGIDIHV